MKIEINNLIEKVLICSPEHEVENIAEMKKVIESYIKEPPHSPRVVCCGLDVIKALTIGLINIFGNDRRGAKMDSETVDGALRLAYDYQDFCETELYKYILSWENLNSPFKVLKL